MDLHFHYSLYENLEFTYAILTRYTIETEYVCVHGESDFLPSMNSDETQRNSRWSNIHVGFVYIEGRSNERGQKRASTRHPVLFTVCYRSDRDQVRRHLPRSLRAHLSLKYDAGDRTTGVPIGIKWISNLPSTTQCSFWRAGMGYAVACQRISCWTQFESRPPNMSWMIRESATITIY